MSTRASILIKDEDSKLYFYRHSDGYPSCTGKDLAEFVQGYVNKTMRDNVTQSAGWLVVRGHAEYNEDFEVVDGKTVRKAKPFTGLPNAEDRDMGWKVGAYEPTNALHSDVAYVYIIDLKAETIECREPKNAFWDKPTLTNTVSLYKTEFIHALKVKELSK